jgi:hypothetical protein
LPARTWPDVCSSAPTRLRLWTIFRAEKPENLPEAAVFHERDGCAEIFEEFEPDARFYQVPRWTRGARCAIRTSTLYQRGSLRRAAIFGRRRSPALLRLPSRVSKLAGSAACTTTARRYGLAYVALRYANVYDPRQNPTARPVSSRSSAATWMRAKPRGSMAAVSRAATTCTWRM